MKITNPRLFWIVSALAIGVLAVSSKLTQLITYPFFLDGDPYFHAAIAQQTIEAGQVPTHYAHAVPAYQLFYPLGSHIYQAALHMLTGISLLDINRFLGPALVIPMVLGVALLAKRLGAGPAGMTVAALLASVIPVWTTRFSITVPENPALVVLLGALFFLFRFIDNRRARDLAWSGGLIGASFILHFGSYLFLPTLFVAVLLYGAWLARTKHHQGLLRFTLVAAISVILTFVAYPQIYSTALSFLVTALAYHDGQIFPAPQPSDWQAHIGYATVVLSIIGLGYLLIRRPVHGLLIGVLLLTVLSLLQILPSLDVFYFLPFRGFTYLALIIIPLVGVAASISRWAVLTAMITALAITSVPLGPSGWDTDLTESEYEAIGWVDQHLPRAALVITQPGNGRQIIFFTQRDTVFDGARGVFYSNQPKRAEEEIRKLGDYPEYYVFISKFKRGPQYNVGWGRAWAFPDANYEQFEDRDFYRPVFENTDVVIYRALLPSSKKS